jgi:hypothetical protein
VWLIEKAKDHYLGISLPHVRQEGNPQQDTNPIHPYWYITSDWLVIVV